MLRITVTKDGGLPQVSTFDKREITIGRTKSNDLVIGEPGVSSSHARLLSTGDGLTLIDLESTNGTFVNGERIRGPALVQPGDEVYICAYRLDFELESDAAAHSDGPPPPVGQPPAIDGPPMIGGAPPPVGAPEYPTPAQLGPPPLAGGDSPPPMVEGSASPAPPPMMDGPPMIGQTPSADTPPPPVSTPPAPAEAPPPVGTPPPPVGTPPPPVEASPPPAPVSPPPIEAAPPPPVEAEAPPPIGQPEPAAPPPVGQPEAATPPPVGQPEPAAPPPVGQPEPATPPPVGQPEPATPPSVGAPPPPVGTPPPPVGAMSAESDAPDKRGLAAVSGSISAPEDIPDVTPRSASPIAPAGLSPAPVAPPTPVEPTPAPLAPIRAALRSPPNEDLSDIKGPGAAAKACARVFEVMEYRLAPDGRLPPRDAQTRARARSEAARLLSSVAERVPEIQARPWANRMANELCGLGALSAPLAETDVVDIYVHGPDRVLVRRGSEDPSPIDAKFSCPAAVQLVVRRLTDQDFGPQAPVVEARTKDGADIRALHDSMTSPGPLVTIHRGSIDSSARGLETLVQQRALPSGMATLLHHCVQAGLNIVVCGGPGARTFSWLAALCAETPAEHRVVVVAPHGEPDPLPSNAVVVHANAFEPREGHSAAQRAVRGALGLAPDRLIVHELGGAEASEVVSAMGRGLRGTACSVRAGSADAGLARLSALVGLAGDSPDAAARARHVAQSVELVVAVSRFADGHTRVTQLAEATVTSAGTVQAVDLVTYEPNKGQWAPTGVAPTFFAELQRRGITVDVGLLGE